MENYHYQPIPGSVVHKDPLSTDNGRYSSNSDKEGGSSHSPDSTVEVFPSFNSSSFSRNGHCQPKNLLPHPVASAPPQPPQKTILPSMTEGTPAELNTSEISLDLHGLIDDTAFAGDSNLFVDGLHVGGGCAYGDTLIQRASPSNSFESYSPGSSVGQVSPSAGGHHEVGTFGPLAYLPGSVHSGSTYSSLTPRVVVAQREPFGDTIGGIKKEPAEDITPFQGASGGIVSSTTHSHLSTSYSVSHHANRVTAPPSTRPPSKNSNVAPQSYFDSSWSVTTAGTTTSPHSITTDVKKRTADRLSEEYRRRRERNNVAVRKSREKAKVRTKETESQVQILIAENARLQKKVELLQEELTVLKSLFTNVGVSPDTVQRESSFGQPDAFPRLQDDVFPRGTMKVLQGMTSTRHPN